MTCRPTAKKCAHQLKIEPSIFYLIDLFMVKWNIGFECRARASARCTQILGWAERARLALARAGSPVVCATTVSVPSCMGCAGHYCPSE